jgi:hypothetical protein
MATKYDDLVLLIQANIGEYSSVADKCLDELRLSMTWIGYYLNCDAGNPALLLAEGAYGAAVESVSLTALGLSRPATLALRSHYELSLQYLFYREHPREWKAIASFMGQSILPGAVKKYLRENYVQYGERVSKLEKRSSRNLSDVYGTLSGVAHGYAINSVSKAENPSHLVCSPNVVASIISICHDTSEVLSDVFLSAFDNNWMSVPQHVRDSVAKRYGSVNPTEELSF